MTQYVMTNTVNNSSKENYKYLSIIIYIIIHIFGVPGPNPGGNPGKSRGGGSRSRMGRVVL